MVLCVLPLRLNCTFQGVVDLAMDDTILFSIDTLKHLDADIYIDIDINIDLDMTRQ